MAIGDDLIEKELMRNRFVRLVGELARGSLTRTSFQPWEVDILLELDGFAWKKRQRVETLKRYQKAVERQLDDGPGPPMTLSGFLQLASSTRRPRIE